ncbi:MAG TPA: hypothetical protein VM324_16560 [Egibacteraceae bacterium]|jgi:hypothetical protein|nr:hypothetical protein [Egibacteraceae bacterium]
MTSNENALNTALVEPPAVVETTAPGAPSGQRRPRWQWLVGVGVVLAIALGGMWAATAPAPVAPTSPAPVAGPNELTDHATHDSGIARLVRERQARFATQHDSGIARFLQERQARLEAQHDSGIARLLRERETTGGGHAAR